MTEVQKQMEDKIHDLLREHFEAGMFVAMSEDEDGRQSMTVSWHGGYFTVRGMLLDALRELEKQRAEDEED